MSWLLAWLIMNATIFAWRLMVAIPEIKTQRQSVRAKRALVATHRG